MLTAADLAETLLDRFTKFGNQTAVCYGDDKLSYTELSNRILAATREIGPCRPGQRVMIVEPNPLASLIAVLAVWRAGASAVQMPAHMPASEIADYAQLAGPISGVGTAVDADSISANRSSAIAVKEECLLLVTSGTSSRPKLAALSAENIAVTVQANANAYGIDETDRYSINGSIAFVSGLVGQSLTGLWAGATIYLFLPSAAPARLLGECRRHSLTVFPGTASMFKLFRHYWNGKPYEQVRLVTQGGEPPSRNMLSWFLAAYPNARLLQRYGMTEAGPRVSYANLEDPRVLEGYIGVPFPYISWHLKTDSKASSDQLGPLCIAGPNVFLGYVQPGGGYAGLDKDGYFQTEDIFYLDRAGDLYFRGRANRAFKCGGQFVNPEQIESALDRIDGVRDANCFAENHELLGQVPNVSVVPEAGAKLSEDDLRTVLASIIEPYQVPRRIEIVSGFDVGPTGKKIIR